MTQNTESDAERRAVRVVLLTPEGAWLYPSLEDAAVASRMLSAASRKTAKIKLLGTEIVYSGDEIEHLISHGHI